MISNKIAKMHREAGLNNITSNEYRRLFTDYLNKDEQYEPLIKLIRWINSNINKNTMPKETKYTMKEFIRAVISDEPVLQLIHPMICDKIINDNDNLLKHVDYIEMYSPLISDLLYDGIIYSDCGTIIRDLLLILAQKITIHHERLYPNEK